MKPPQDLTTRMVAHMDNANTLSLSEIIDKFRVRWKLFLTCVLLVPILLVALRCFVPIAYKASAQLLVSREGSAAFFKDVMSERETITAQSAAEVVRSIPVCSRMIETVGVTDEDVARSAVKTLVGNFLRMLKPLLGKEEDDTRKDPKLKTQRLAETLKDSIETSTLQIDRSIINPRDELIEVKIKSTNRLKVAAMVNELCRSFIEEYNKRAAEDAMRAHAVLTAQAQRVQAEIATLREPIKETTGDASITTTSPTDPTESGTAQAKPLTQGMGSRISDLEMKVIELQRIYTDTSPEVVRAKEELEHARSSLSRQEALDGATALLDLLRKKQRQAMVNAALHRNNQSGIVLIEEGITPSPSKAALVLHFGLPLVGGTIGGLILGTTLVLLLGALDTRIQTSGDLARIGGLPLLLKTSPLTAPVSPTSLNHLPPEENVGPLLRVCSAMELAAPKGGRQTVLVSSADHHSDRGETALQLACLLAQNSQLRVLLIDGDLEQSALTKLLRLGSEPGLVEALNAQSLLADSIHRTSLSNLSIIPAGHLGSRPTLGFFGEVWRQRLDEMRSSYDVVVLSAPGVIDRSETPVLAREIDHALIVTIQGATPRPALERAVPMLGDLGLDVLGTTVIKPAARKLPA